MKVVITGGSGFLGRRLAQRLLQLGELVDAQGQTRSIDRLVLFDVNSTALPRDPRLAYVDGDLASAHDVLRALDGDTDSVFHLAAVVSGQAEQSFDVGMRVNIDGMLALLEGCRVLPRPPKVVFTSSIATFGGPLPDPVPDLFPQLPQTSYGAQKAVGELLVSDMSRKGFIDGRSVRLPTIVVRPGKANKAASGFASGIIREPLAGVQAVCPVPPDTRMWVLSPTRAVDSLIVAHNTPDSAFSHSRSINVPGLTAKVGDMVAALRQIAGDAVADRVLWQPDPDVTRMVTGWPAAFEADFGRAIGMRGDADFAAIIRQHIQDEAAAPA